MANLKNNIRSSQRMELTETWLQQQLERPVSHSAGSLLCWAPGPGTWQGGPPACRLVSSSACCSAAAQRLYPSHHTRGGARAHTELAVRLRPGCLHTVHHPPHLESPLAFLLGFCAAPTCLSTGQSTPLLSCCLSVLKKCVSRLVIPPACSRHF